MTFEVFPSKNNNCKNETKTKYKKQKETISRSWTFKRTTCRIRFLLIHN